MTCLGHTTTHGRHCGACHKNFGSQYAFDQHRTGPVSERRCMLVADLVKAGWKLDAKGRWRTPGGTVPSDIRT